MAEYIEREAAIKATCFNCTEKNICDGICDDTDRLRAIPAADVAPVVTSRWVFDNWEHHWTCLNCMHSFSMLTVGNAREEWDYCPNCGARMDGDGE